MTKSLNQLYEQDKQNRINADMPEISFEKFKIIQKTWDKYWPGMGELWVTEILKKGGK